MTTTEPNDATSTPPPGRFQYRLRTLLLVSLVLASSLAVFGAGGIVVFALVAGLALYVHQVESPPSLAGVLLVLIGLMCLIGLLLPAVHTSREAPRRMQCGNNLKQIMLALHNYHQANGHFPPAYIADKNGKPMHSWRVLLLPYFECEPLYKSYDFSEPWDGPNNKKLLAGRPWLYACPSDPNAHSSDPNARAPGATQTSYVAVVGPNAAWLGEKPRKLAPADLPGWANNTIMLVEVANSGIPWTEPRDLSLDALGVPQGKQPALTLSSRHLPYEEFFYTYNRSAIVNVAVADGTTFYLRPGNLPIDVLRNLLQVGGCPQDEIRSQADFYGEGGRLNWPNIAALAVWFLSVAALLRHAVRSRRPLRETVVQPGVQEGS